MLKTLRSPKHQRLIELLVDTRKKAGFTQVVLAQRLGRPQSFVAKVENGERRLDVIEFIELIEAAGGEPNEIFARVLGC